jgi:transposase InsO family protein
MIKAAPISVNKACKAFEVSKQAFYKWKKQEHLYNEDNEILLTMQSIAAEFPKYGYRRVTYALRRDGVVVNHKKVRRIMKENNLLVRRKKSKPITTQSNHGLHKYPNLVKDVVLTGINQAWVADITYISLLYEFVYLAVIMDLFSRCCIGWAMSRNPDSHLTLDALNMAIAMRGNVEGCIHHSDHGVQYAAHVYVERLHDAGMKPSMGEKGNSYENAFAESLIKTIKCEEVYMNEYKTMEDACCNIEQFIKEVYNKKRLHSSIGYKPPMEFEAEVLNRRLL